jgi:hypothetical protein
MPADPTARGEAAPADSSSRRAPDVNPDEHGAVIAQIDALYKAYSQDEPESRGKAWRGEPVLAAGDGVGRVLR